MPLKNTPNLKSDKILDFSNRLEGYLSGKSIEKRYNEQFNENIPAKEIFSRYRKKDSNSTLFINEYKEVLIDALSYDLLERHKNDRKIIASGSLNFIVKGFSKFFSIDTFFGTPLEIKNNEVTGNLDGVPTFAEGKLSTMQKWSEENNFQLNEAIFYTDSINDLPLVKACKHSIIISPDKELEKYAKENSLEIIYR